MLRRNWKPRLATTVIDRNHPLSQGLAAWWLMNERGGTTVYDLSGRRINGTLTNGPVWSNGRNGTALDFDGSDDVVTYPSVGITGPPVTLTAWVKPDTTGSFRGIVADDNGKGSLASNASGDLTYFWDITADEYGAATGLSFTLGGWNFCAVIITSSAATIYLNKGSGFQTFVNTKTHVSASITSGTLGSDRQIGGHFFDGIIDDARIYSRALTQNEIMQLYVNPFANLLDKRLVVKSYSLSTFNSSRYFFFFN